MDEGSPILGVGFSIDFGDSFGGLKTLDDLIGTTAANGVRQFQQLEKAVAGGLSLGDASAQFSAFAATTSNAFDKAEVAAERLTARLKEQAATFGMTKAAAVAWRAEQAGATDAAQELLAAEAALNTVRAEAAQRTIAEAEAVRQAGEAYATFEAVARQRMAAYRDQQAAEAAAAREAAATAAVDQRAADAAQARIAAERQLINQLAERSQVEAAIANIDGSSRPAAIQSGAGFTALAAQADAEDKLAAAAARLRASIDPAYASQQRFDREMTDARALISAGAISLDDYCAKLRQETGLLNTASDAHSRMGAQLTVGTSGAVSMAEGVAGLGRSSQGATIEMLEMTHIARSLTEQIASGVNPVRAMTLESGRLMTAIQYGGAGVGSFVKQFASMLGIIKTVQNAELAEAAANAAAQEASIQAVANRVKASIAASEADIELALAAQRVATSDVEASAAAAQLAAVYEAQAVAAGQLTIAENALAAAQGRSAEASEASKAATSTSIGATGMLLGILAVGAAAAFGAFKIFQDQVKDSGELTRYRDNLGLTHRELLELGDGVDKVGDKIKTLGDVTVTAGDVMAGLWQTIKDRADTGGMWDGFKSGAATAFGYVLEGWNAVSAGITASIYGTVTASKVIWNNFATSVGDVFYQAVNLAIDAMNKLVKAGTDILNGFVHAANKVPGVNIGDFTAPQMADVTNPYAGKASQAAADTAFKAVKAGFSDSYAAARKDDDDFWKHVGANAVQHHKDAVKEQADALKDNRNPTKPKADPNVRAEAELQAAIKGQWDLAAAYQISDAAAMKAEALQKAEEDAIKHRGETGIYYELELQKAVATAAAAGAKRIADLTVQAAAQKVVNDAVAAGILPASQASAALQAATEKRQLEAALVIATEKGRTAEVVKLKAELASLSQVQSAANAEANRAQVLAATAAGGDQLARLRLEAQLIGATNEVRAVAIAQLEAEQYLAAHPGATPDEAQKYVDVQKRIAEQTAANTAGQNNYNNSLSYTADLLGLINDNAQNLASSLSAAFGNIGGGIGKALTALTSYAATQAKIDQEQKAAIKAAGTGPDSYAAISQIEILAAQKSATARAAATGQAIDGIKSLFAEHSTAYKVMQGVEEVYAAFQAAETIASIARDLLKTGSSLANSAVRTTANTAEGASKIFAALGPWAFPVVDAMIALIASLGFKGGGGGSAVAPTSAADLQKAAGTDTVLGSPNDKSASIANSLALVAKNTSGDLQYSSQMLSSLKSIDASIGALAATVAKQLNVSGAIGDTSKLNLGSSGSAGFLGLFASSTTRTLYDAGITLAATTVGNIVANGISGQTYQIVEQVKKSSGFLGIGGGTKTTYQTTTGALPSDITASIQSVIGALENGIVTAAGAIGVSGAKAMLDNFNVNIGKVSFNGLDAKGIEDQLNAIFSSVGDQMVTAILPSIEKFQKAGEGLFETLERVASTVVAVDAEFKKLGHTTMSIEADMGVAGQFDSIGDFTSAADAYFSKFYSTAEQTAAQLADMQQVFASLNLAMPPTLTGFRQLVDAQDLTTAAGQAAYATLLKVAPAFADLQQAMSGAKSAADALSEQQNLMNQLWQLQGNTAAIRAAQLAQLDPSNRALQEQVWAVSDAQDAAKAAADLASAWSSVGDSIKAEIDRIRGLDTTTGGSFASLQGQFNAATAAARGGDQGAAKNLPGLSQALLTAAGTAATSRQELDRVQAQTAASLQATYDAIQKLSGNPASATSTDTLLAAAATTTSATTPAAANDDLLSAIERLEAEVTQLRTDNNAGLATVAGATSRTAKHLDDVTAASGGTAISTVQAA